MPLAEIASTVREQYDADDADELVGAFVAELASEDLLVTTDEPMPRDATWELPALDSDFVGPRLEKFTDMQHLILLDPVHEVDAGQGWPIRLSDA